MNHILEIEVMIDNNPTKIKYRILDLRKLNVCGIVFNKIEDEDGEFLVRLIREYGEVALRFNEIQKAEAIYTQVKDYLYNS